MYKLLEIIKKNGELVFYEATQWDDYSFTGNAVVVKKDGVWVAIYNFDDIHSVKLCK